VHVGHFPIHSRVSSSQVTICRSITLSTLLSSTGESSTLDLGLASAIQSARALARVHANLRADTDHCLSEIGRNLCENGGVVVVCNGLNDGSCSLGWVSGEDYISAPVLVRSATILTNTRSDKDTITSELHHQSSIGGGSNTTSGEPVRQPRCPVILRERITYETTGSLFSLAVSFNKW